MKTLRFETIIDATPQKVWETMLGKETYPTWVGAGWPGSTFHGEWKQGARIRFTGADGGGGTLGEVVELDPYAKVDLHHIAVLLDDGSEDRESDIAKGWIGSTETYTFTPDNGATRLDVALTIPADFVEEFEDGWPKALAVLEQLAEQ